MKTRNISLGLLALSSLTVISCGKSNESVNKQSDSLSEYLVSLKSASQELTVASLNSLKVHGKYKSCSGKTDGETWIISNSVTDSTLLVKKDDKNCKLSVTAFDINLDGTQKQFKSKIPEGIPITSNYLAISSVFESNVGQPLFENLFAHFKITPEDFSAKPTIYMQLAKMRGETNESNTIKDVMVLEQENINFNIIDAPDYKVENKNLSIFLDPTDSKISNKGQIEFITKRASNTFDKLEYIVLPGNTDTSSFDKALNLFTTKVSSVVNVVDQSKFNISAQALSVGAEFPAKWTIPANTLSSKIILKSTVTKNSTKFSSFQIFTVVIKK